MFGTFIDGLIKQQVSTYINQKIGGALDLGKTETSGLADQMIGSLLGGLAHNSKSDTGATSLLNALDKDHDGSILDDLSDIASMENKGQGIVTHIFGNKKAKVTALIAEKTGLDTTTIEQLLTGVAPVLMGALGKKQHEEKLDTKQLTHLLTEEKNNLDTDSSLSPLLALLDKDGDGDVDLDDLTS